MARSRRIAVANYPHHVVQRGHNHQAVFVSDDDRRAYLKTLAECRERFALKVYGYCLMTNHVHLIIDPGVGTASLSRLMKRLAGRHTRRLNSAGAKSGSAWDGRFKCSVIETDRYLLACSRYVDLNPVRASLVARPEDYPWSSYRAKAGQVQCPWLDEDPCYFALAPERRTRERRYQEFVELGVAPHELGALRSAIQGNQPTGSDEFREDVEIRVGFELQAVRPGRPRKAREPDLFPGQK